MVDFEKNIIKITLDDKYKEIIMAKYLNGSSLFTAVNAGLTSSYSVLSNQYTDGVTLENINKSFTNQSILANGNTAAFSSYLSTNFNSFDKNKDGKISADEIQNFMTNISQQGMTREQMTMLGSASGMSGSLLETVLNHFDEIDANHDGKVTNQEIQSYGVTSALENQKIEDRNRMINHMSMFYGDSAEKYEGSLMNYKYLSDDDKK